MSALENAIANCVARMSILKFFPSDPVTRSELMQLIKRMITHPSQAEWLGNAMVTYFNEWPGPLALRAMVSQRWRPADGRSADMQGFGGTLEAEIENRAITAANEFKQITSGAAKLIGELIPRQIEAGDPNAVRRAEQHKRWNAVCAAMPAIHKNSKRLCNEFATTEDLERREEILHKLEMAVYRMQNV